MRQARDSGPRALARLADFAAPDMVYVGTVRSRSSRGKIGSINLPHLPRGYLGVTAADIPGERFVEIEGCRVPVLASDRVEYRGEPVALVFGPDRGKVAEAVSLARVRIERLEPEYGFEQFDSGRETARAAIGLGDVDSAMAASDRIVEGEYRFGAQDHYYPEPQGAAALFDYDKMVVYSSTQWPFQVRASVAAVLGVKCDEVTVRSTSPGTHLDGKLWYPSLLACHAALAAYAGSRPALLSLTREEDFLNTGKRAPAAMSARAGLDAEGRLRALDCRVVFNVGAYEPFAGEMAKRASKAAAGAYHCPNLRVSAHAVSTNLPPMGALAGFGTGPAWFGIERLAEDCAAAVDVDPSVWRELNADGPPAPGMGRRPAPYRKIVEPLLAASDYPRKRSSYELLRKRAAEPAESSGFGIGLAFVGQDPAGDFGRAASSAPAVEVTLSKDSRLVIRSSVVPSSRAAAESWRRVAAEILGLKASSVAIEPVDTDRVPDSGPATMSRAATAVTKLVVSACEGLASKRFREALPITVRRAKARKKQAEEPAWAGAVVEVALDPVDSAPKILGIWIVAAAGRLISEADAMRAIERDAAIAVGMCVGERLDLGDGPPSEDDLRRYRLQRDLDAPPIHVAFVKDDSEPRGIGELAFALVPPAFANALGQAMDSRMNAMPLEAPGERTEALP